MKEADGLSGEGSIKGSQGALSSRSLAEEQVQQLNLPKAARRVAILCEESITTREASGAEPRLGITASG